MDNVSLEAQLEVILGKMAALQDQITIQQARLNELEARPTPTPPNETPTMTSRRRMLRRLAGGVVAGLAIGGATLATTSPAQARLVSNNSTTIGAFSIAPGGNLPTGNLTPPQGFPPAKYGLLGTDGTVLNLSTSTSLPVNPAGVVGYAASGSNSSGVVGVNVGTLGNGVRGIANGEGGIGVRADADGQGVRGIYTTASSDVTDARAIYAAAFGPDAIGVYSQASGTNSLAGNFQGNVSITGTLNVTGNVSKSGGSFKIDHPQDPANQYLYHSFVESPDMKNIYDGVVTLDGDGAATVELPDWFEALNTDFRYGLTAIGAPSPDLYIAEEVKGSIFKIAGGQAGQRVSWQLTGIRQDEWAKAYRIPVEEVKPDHDKGLYLHPELLGLPEEKGISYVYRRRK